MKFSDITNESAETVTCPACKKPGTIPDTDSSGKCKCIKCGNTWTTKKKTNEAFGEEDWGDGPGMLDQPENNEIEMQLQELEEAMYAVIEIAQSLRRSGRTVSGPFAGQINSYFIPWMKSFMDDTSQPGSIASLRRMLSQE